MLAWVNMSNSQPICQACKQYPAYYEVRIINKMLCIYCYHGIPTPSDGIVHQSTDWSKVVTQ